VPGLEPQDGELVVKKYRSSAFWGTNLGLLLRSNGIKSVVVSGCTTEGCVESTARDAMFSDYYVVLAADAVGSDDRKQHDASMYLMAHRFDLATSEDIRKHWPARNR
jgi:nicotinamidase-related amidase